MAEWTETTIDVGGTELVVVRGGAGAPLLVLHDELGYPGWLQWTEALAEHRTLLIPLQPGFGRTEKVEWVRSYRDLAAFYARVIREQGWAPIDVLGFSAGGYIAAELASISPELVGRMGLVAPMGIKPAVGEILDFLTLPARAHVAVTVSRTDAPEFGSLYGADAGTVTPEQFLLFEEARSETARLGWEPFMHDPSLPYLLEGIGDLPTLLLWGMDDLVVPEGCIDEYERALPNATVVKVPGVGHRPEIEDVRAFVEAVTSFFGS